jgi:hypothetical protein
LGLFFTLTSYLLLFGQFEDITLLMTLFVLFGDDIRLLCTPRTAGERPR